MSSFSIPIILKKSMDNLTKILMTVWMVLAIASFVCSFWAAPLLVKVIGLVFGSLNLMIIGSWVISYFQDRAAARKYEELKEIEEKNRKIEEELAKAAAEEAAKPKKTKKTKKEE